MPHLSKRLCLVTAVCVPLACAAANRASLSGVSHVAAGVFDLADQWAFENMRRLGMDPRAGLRLHDKLVAQGAAENAFLLDARRLAAIRLLPSTPALLA